MLSVRNSWIRYGSKIVVRDVSLDIPAGKMVALIGPNGSGKTTLVRGISGTLPLEKGRVTYQDHDLRDLPETDRAKLISVVPQITQFPAGFTVFETVSLGRTPYLGWMGKLSVKDIDLIEAAIMETSIGALREKDVLALSGGEQQRVVLARALAQDTPVLILDEPTAHLDLTYQIGLLTIVRRICTEKQLSVLIVLHDLNLAARFADAVAIMDEGQILTHGAPEAVLTKEILSPVFHLPMSVIRPEEFDYPVILPQ